MPGLGSVASLLSLKRERTALLCVEEVGVTADSPIAVGVAGLGLGAMFTVPWFLADERFVVVAAADTREAARREFTRRVGRQAFSTVDELVRDPTVELVYVATPHFLHAEHAMLAIDAGKHVLVEKPLARTAEEAEAIVVAAQARGVSALYGHTHAYDPAIRKIAEIVSMGELGRLAMILTFNYNDLMYRPRAAWELDLSLSGGSPFIQGAHQIDVVRVIGGEPFSEARTWSRVLDPTRRVPGVHMATLEFRSGAVASICYSGYGGFDSAGWYGWVGEDGRPRDPGTHARTHGVHLDRAGRREAEEAGRDMRRVGLARLPVTERPRSLETFGITVVSCEKGDLRPVPSGVAVYSGEGEKILHLESRSGRELMLDEIWSALHHGRAPLIDARWAVETVRLCERMSDAQSVR